MMKGCGISVVFARRRSLGCSGDPASSRLLVYWLRQMKWLELISQTGSTKIIAMAASRAKKARRFPPSALSGFQPSIDRQQTLCAQLMLGRYSLLLAPLGGMVNVSSHSWLSLPGRTGQQRKPLTLSVRLCKGSCYARFPRCQSNGQNST